MGTSLSGISRTWRRRRETWWLHAKKSDPALLQEKKVEMAQPCWTSSRSRCSISWLRSRSFVRDGKQKLGMPDCQLRHDQGQTRHVYLVMLAYALLADSLGRNRAKACAFGKPTILGEACRAVMGETLRSTLTGAVEQATRYSYNVDHTTAWLCLT